jgi:hypothetical protein
MLWWLTFFTCVVASPVAKIGPRGAVDPTEIENTDKVFRVLFDWVQFL